MNYESETAEEKQARLEAYYERRRKRRNAMNRHNYKTDPKKRKKILKAVKRYDKKKRREARYYDKIAARGASIAYVPGDRSPGTRMMVDLSDGTEKELILYTLVHVADALEVDKLTVLSWIKRGIIPEPLFYRGTTRLYTEDQILMFKEVFGVYADTRKWPWALSPIPASIYEQWALMPDGLKND